ncbi:MAG: FAD-dependent oxidoreductase [Acholeplasmatales bacterium]|nr:MAG: FAD-dependent oxidoreductase [Acholeplasmatales bacterium]
MKHVEVLIIGAGPAGLSAADVLLEAGAEVALIDRSDRPGGQLTKQTHMFFGSQEHYASKRGIEILHVLYDKIKDHPRLHMFSETTVAGLYPDRVVACVSGQRYFTIQADIIIVATGASEKSLPFENNDLPGVYAAGAVQTLMNVYGVKPGDKVLMVGSGNIGLIVAYQLMQAGVKVPVLVEAAKTISGYHVHASKIRRLGVDIRMRTSIKRALGTDHVEGAQIWQLDARWQGIAGTEETIEVDTICLAVGLSPLTELLQQLGAEVIYINELGGHVPRLNEKFETTVEGVYACGDVAGIEEASSAMIAGKIAGLEAALKQGYALEDAQARQAALHTSLKTLRSGPHGEKIRKGHARLGART